MDLGSEGARLLDFGRASAVPGGFGWLGDAGEVLDRPLQLWITCRMTHVYALAHLQGVEGAGELVDHGLRSLRETFHDDEHGGWFAEVGDGGPIATSKTCYEHAFVVLAASSAAAADRPGAEDLLDEAVDVLMRFWDDEHRMLAEEWDRSWSTLDAYRGVNANMHGVEALLAAADVLVDDSLRTLALAITSRVVGTLGPEFGWRLPEHFTPDWEPLLDYNVDAPAHPFRPYGATVGHALEWARLALHLDAALGSEAPVWLVPHARSLFAGAVSDGWAVDGAEGFVYTTDSDGVPVVRERMHWVVAEAIATATTLAAVTGESSYADWASTWWRHVEEHVVDPENGSWRHELSPELRPSATVWEGRPDLYHAYQATLFEELPLAPTMATALRDRGA